VSDLTADAVLQRSLDDFLSADAVLQRSLDDFLSADAVLQRSLDDFLSADAVFMPCATASAVIHRTQTVSVTAGAWIYAARQDPAGPGQPGETPLISVIVDGFDITKNVVVVGATFTMQVNGIPGQFSFLVRDDAHELDFTSGAEVTVDIDGRRKFGGYLLTVKRKFFFPVEGTATPTDVSRAWLLEGVDYNILFNKRVAWYPPNPTKKFREWPVGSRDDVVIKYVFDNYTDLGADGVTYSGVTHIGSINPDMAGVIGSPGFMFGSMMTEINRLIGGVFYIDQFKDLNFVDVDTPNADLSLSDHPVGPTVVGYRELMQIENGAKLANDALVWGAALGSKNLRFGRSEDTPSINAHGRWQYGEYTTQMYKQASVNERASTVVYGTDQNKRGGKDDQESWTVTTFDNSFSAGQKVEIASEVFGKSDVVPIRRCTLTFETKVKPRYQLTLSHEIDLPWNTFETRWPNQNFKPPPPIIICLTCGPTGTPCDCGTTDTFTRTVAGGWGISDSGIVWDMSPYNWGTAGAQSVNGSQGVMYADPWVDGYAMASLPAPLWPPPLDLTFFGVYFETDLWDATGPDFQLYFTEYGSPVGVYVKSNGLVTLEGDDYISEALGFPLDTDHKVDIRLTIDAGYTVANMYVWQSGTTQPSTPTVTVAPVAGPFFGHPWNGLENLILLLQTQDAVTPVTLYIDGISIAGVDRCTQYCSGPTDDFTRTVADGWGGGWEIQPGGGSTASVDGSSGLLSDGTYIKLPLVIVDELEFTFEFTPAADATNVDFRLYTSDASDPMTTFGMSLAGWDAGVLYFQTGIPSGWTSDYIETAHGVSAGGGTYRVRVVSNGSYSKFRVWDTAGAEPSVWLIDHTYSFQNVTPISKGSRGIEVYGGGGVTAFDNLQNRCSDPNHPCYRSCGGITDTFNRPDGPLGTSDSGLVWVYEWDDGRLLILGGQMTHQQADSGSQAATLMFSFPLPVHASFDLDLSGYPGGHVYASMTCNDYIVATVSIDQTFLDGGLYTTFITATLTDGSSTASSVGQVSDIPALGPVVIDLTADTLTASFDGVTVSANRSSAAPPLPAITSAADWRMELLGQSSQIKVDNLDIEGLVGCTDVTESSSVALLGRNASVGDGVTKVFNVGAAYYPGSTTVYVNGYFYRLGREYTESNPSGGEITFTNAPAEAADIDFFYDASGAIY
jgi:hypothetical protein